MVDGSVLQGRYRLERRLATGGMGTVYDGMDERLHRRVAVKLLRQEFADDPRFIERFRREARAVASLSHPYIANVYDYGKDADKHFIVMEFAAGRDLAQILRAQAPLSVERAVHIGTQLCEALEHAHTAGIIHRDVKPANIIVDDDDRVRVTDFGIARAVGDSTLTETGSILGSAHYLSPEQARGIPLAPASDLYSAGIVVYEMLTGTVPFTGDSAIAIAMQHMNEDVPAPSKLNPSVTPHLDAVVARATAKEPGARYQSARDMAEALANWERREPTLVAGAAAQPSSTQSLQPAAVGRYTPRGVTRAALLSLAGLVLLAGSVLAFRVLTDSGEEPSAASNRSSGGAAQRGEPTPNEPAEEAEAETSPTSTEPTDGILISEDFIGARSKDVEKLLEGEGVIVESIDQDSEEEKDTVLGVEPPPGTTVAEGDTITLTVSTGKAAEEEDDEDDD